MKTNTPGLVSKIIYGTGAIAYGVKDNGFSTFLMLYFNQVLGVAALQVGLALLIAMVFDAITDPYVGHISDRWTSPLGRRHPFMYAAILPAALVYFSLWNPPADFGTGALFGWLLIMATLVRLTITFFEVPNSAMIPELDRSYDGRTRLSGMRQMFGWLGGVVMAVTAYLVYLRPVGDVPGVLNRQGYESFALLAAIVMAVSMLVSSLGTHRLIKSLPQPDPSSAGHAFSFMQSIRNIFAQPAFRAVFLGSLFSSMVFGVSGTLQSYFAAFYYGQSAVRIGFLALALLPAALMAYPLTAWLTRRREKREIAIFLIWMSLLTGSLWIAAKYAGLVPDNEHVFIFPFLVLNTFVATLFLISLQIVLVSMTADLVEANQRETGHRADGLYMATFSFTRKVVTGLGMFCSGVLLSLGGGEIMNEATMHIVALPYLILTTVLYLTAIFFLRRFTLTRAGHAENLDAVGAREVG